MLRINDITTVRGPVWTLCGQLAGPWVAELRSCWEQARPASQGQKYLVDLSEVTFIDESGEKLLRQMHSEGAEFVAAGIDTKHVVEHLEAEDRQPLRMFMAHLADRCSAPDGD